MKVAAVSWQQNYETERVFEWMMQSLQRAKVEQVDVFVFPALIGNFFSSAEQFIRSTRELSESYPEMLICPGSYWEKVSNQIYHTSIVLQNGKTVAKQRQLYLSKWERNFRLSRGEELTFFHYENIKMTLILSSDAFYPQVARYAAMNEVEVVLSPVAIIEPTSYAKQLSGLWQNVQQNLFFAIESAFIGGFNHYHFDGITQIHAPLELTDDEHGILAKSNETLITTTLPIERLDWAKRFYHPIRQLNKMAYESLYK